MWQTRWMRLCPLGFLSRRDKMMVAWHEVPGNNPVKIRPVGYGMVVSPLSRNQGAYTH
jgi:hypothetical protein